MLKDLFKGSAIYGITPFIPRILSVILLPILTKYLTSTDYGIIGSITSITFAVQALHDLGLRALLPNYFYKSRGHYKVMWREIYGFLSLWMILYALIQATLLYFFIPKEAESNKWLIIILSNFSTVFFGPTSIIGNMYYQLSLKPMPVAIRGLVSGIITILANFVCVVYFKWGYLGAYVGTFAGLFLVNASYWPVLNRKLGLSPIYKFKWRSIKQALKVSLPTIPHYYTAYLMNSTNVVAMNYYDSSQAEIGHLTMAQNINNMFNTVINAVNQVFSPMCYQYIRENNPKEMKRMFYTYALIAYSLTFLYSLWSKEAYSILISNEELAATYRYSIVLAMALNYRPLYVYSSNYFFYHEKTIQLLGISLVSGLICTAFYFIMTPYWGVDAAVIGFYIGSLYYGYSGYFYSFYKKHTVYKVKWIFALLIQVLLTLVAYFAVDTILPVKIGITIVFLAIVFYIFNSQISQIKTVLNHFNIKK